MRMLKGFLVTVLRRGLLAGLLLVMCHSQGAPLPPARKLKTPACSNLHADAECEDWARAGECDKNVGFMRQQCARSCDTCGFVDTTCLGLSPPAKQNGEINAMFERAITFEELGPKVHSREPWIVTFDHFLSDEEAAAFLSTTDHSFKRSAATFLTAPPPTHSALGLSRPTSTPPPRPRCSSLAGDMVSPVRTSQQAWCQQGIATDCEHHPLVNRVHERVVNVTGVPKNNGELGASRSPQAPSTALVSEPPPVPRPCVRPAEFFQVLRYEEGQFYRTHHDQNSAADSLMGVRLFTFFMYLHSPDEGGGTHFPNVNVTIQPRKGSALVWPNVLDNDVRRADMRTNHEALPPLRGLKFSANLWVSRPGIRVLLLPLLARA